MGASVPPLTSSHDCLEQPQARGQQSITFPGTVPVPVITAILKSGAQREAAQPVNYTGIRKEAAAGAVVAAQGVVAPRAGVPQANRPTRQLARLTPR